MFLCRKCGKKRGFNPTWWFMGIGISYGPCEDCGKNADCADVQLPPMKKKWKPPVDKAKPPAKKKKPYRGFNLIGGGFDDIRFMPKSDKS